MSNNEITLPKNFKGIWLPKEVVLIDNITTPELLVLGIIQSLDNENGCFASNGYIGSILKLSKGRISKIISDLNKKNLIQVFPNIMEGNKRIIFLKNTIFKDHDTPEEIDPETPKNFKGIWLSKEVVLIDNITTPELLVLGIIQSLDNENGCFASNGYIGSILKLSKGRISKIISDLNKKDLIQIFPNTIEGNKRIIFLKSSIFKNHDTPEEIDPEVILPENYTEYLKC